MENRQSNYGYRINLLSIFLFSCLFLHSGCKQATYDGTYCAIVNYYNPNTGTKSEYILTVIAGEDQLEQINFPDGYINESNFIPQKISSDGQVTISSDKGYQYSVLITGPAKGCFDITPKLNQCKGITQKGERCKKLTDNSNGLCHQHRTQ